MAADRPNNVLITGAGNGIGRALVDCFLSAGDRVMALDVRTDTLEQLRRDIPHDRLSVRQADVTQSAATRSAIEELEAEIGPTDVLIASAGIGKGTPALAFDADAVNQILSVNLLGVVNSIDPVLPGMLRRRRGHLVALSSLASYRGFPLMGGYCASKAGLNALMDSLRVELKPHGVRVSTICPGWIRTPMTKALGLAGQSAMALEEAAPRIFRTIRDQREFDAFPSRLAFRVWLLRQLPRRLGDWLTARELARSRGLRSSLRKDNSGV